MTSFKQRGDAEVACKTHALKVGGSIPPPATKTYGMNRQEFSDTFSLLWNDIASNQAPGLNEWEKSVFLTKAQNQLVKEYFNSRTDAVGGGFDGSQKRQYDFSSIILTKDLVELSKFLPAFSNGYKSITKIDKRSKVFLFPEDYFLSVNEILSDGKYQYSVLPIDYEEYQRLMLKPYSMPVKRGAWRLITGSTNIITQAQVILRETAAGDIPEDNPDNTPESPSDAETQAEYIMSDGSRATYSVRVTYHETSSGLVELHTLTITSSTTPSEEDIATIVTGLNDKVFKGGSKAETINSVTFVPSTTPASSISTLHSPSVSGNMPTTSSNSHTINPEPVTPKDNIAGDDEPASIEIGELPLVVPTVEIIGKFKGELNYRMRYVKKLEPIVLEDLPDGLQVDGVSKATECKLPEECHEEIVERAVTLAKIAWQGGTLTQAQSAQAKED